jgi:alginate O-acetyltransferase complex protein AlgI
MLFNDSSFALFLSIVFFIFWFIIPKNKLNLQNGFLVLASYFFYSFWDYRFLVLLAFSTIVDYSIGIAIYKTNNTNIKKFWLYSSLVINLGVLLIFKYFNFFLDSIFAVLGNANAIGKFSYLNIVIPVGISFYTFHGISYVLDIYKNKIQPTYDFLAYSLFVSFFPLLVAGPIERANHLLPQLKNPRHFDQLNGIKGLKQILWGLFKKMVIADNCQVIVDYTFNNYSNLPGSNLILGAIFFSFQIYCDFSGYTDIAIGTGRLFGIELLRNFDFPYFSKNIIDFWKKWHISLTSWFRDYIYLPLGGSRNGLLNQIKNILIVFLISGLWHGANWTFILWGLLNGIFYILTRMIKEWNLTEKFVKFQLIQYLFTFSLVSLLWIFFRSSNITSAILFIDGFLNASIFENPFKNSAFDSAPLMILLIIFLLRVEWKGRLNEFAIENPFFNNYKIFEMLFYSFILFLIGMYCSVETSPFIYFQF